MQRSCPDDIADFCLSLRSDDSKQTQIALRPQKLFIVPVNFTDNNIPEIDPAAVILQTDVSAPAGQTRMTIRMLHMVNEAGVDNHLPIHLDLNLRTISDDLHVLPLTGRSADPARGCLDIVDTPGILVRLQLSISLGIVIQDLDLQPLICRVTLSGRSQKDAAVAPLRNLVLQFKHEVVILLFSREPAAANASGEENAILGSP